MQRIFGTTTPEHAELIDFVKAYLGPAHATIMVFPPVPIGSKPCQHPGRIRLEVLLGNTAYAVYKDPNKAIVSTLPRKSS